MSSPFGWPSAKPYHRWRGGRIALLAAIAAGALASVRWLLKARPFRLEISGASMEPTLLPGDWVLVTRGKVARGHVVVLQHPLRPGVELVKRIAADPRDDMEGAPVGPGGWYVLGDAPDRSTDSRHFGPVSDRILLGRVRLIYWPPNRWGSLRPKPL